jgi:hypothetical protein
MTDELEIFEYAPGRFRMRRPVPPPVAASSLPAPHVIRDEMEPTEQVNGKFYTSKAKFRAVGRALGLTEVGNDPARLVDKKPTRASTTPAAKRARRQAFEKATAEYKQGRRPRRPQET